MEQIIAAARDVQEKKEIYSPYNILPLDAAGASQSIMQLEEVVYIECVCVSVGMCVCEYVYIVTWCLVCLMLRYLFPYQVKAAVAALWNTRGLNWPASFEPQRQKSGDLDLLDWLRAMFGFQACC